MPEGNRGLRWERAPIPCTAQLAPGLAESRSHLFLYVFRVVHPSGRTIPHAHDGTVRHATELSLSHLSLLLLGHVASGRVVL